MSKTMSAKELKEKEKKQKKKLKKEQYIRKQKEAEKARKAKQLQREKKAKEAEKAKRAKMRAKEKERQAKENSNAQTIAAKPENKKNTQKKQQNVPKTADKKIKKEAYIKSETQTHSAEVTDVLAESEAKTKKINEKKSASTPHVEKKKKEKTKSVDDEKRESKLKDKLKSVATGKTMYIFIGVAMLIGIIVIISANVYNVRMREKVSYEYTGVVEDSVRALSITLDEQLQRAEELKTYGQDAEIKYFAREKAELKEYYSNGSVVLGNVSSNKTVFIVTVLSRDGEILYRSDGIKPGQYLPAITLFKPLEDGEYSTRLYVSAYDEDTNELVSVRYSKLKLVIGDVE